MYCLLGPCCNCELKGRHSHWQDNLRHLAGGSGPISSTSSLFSRPTTMDISVGKHRCESMAESDHQRRSEVSRTHRHRLTHNGQLSRFSSHRLSPTTYLPPSLCQLPVFLRI